MGLVLFGTRAFLVTPLTYDLSAVRAQLQGAVVGLAGTETAIGDAIAIAVKRLLALPERSRTGQAPVIVLLSTAAGIPICASCITWSCISAISGETTTVVLPSTNAGNW